MWVYGDHARRVDPRERLASLRKLLRPKPEADAFQIEDCRRSGAVLAGELAQGLIDAEFETAGNVDDLTPLAQAAIALCIAVAAGDDEAPGLDRLQAMALPPHVVCKQAEGFAFYAVYPEAYAQAARAQPWTVPPLVIGLRSIGTTLAAYVAAAIETAGVLTLRPQGDPFDRRLAVSRKIEALIRGHAGEFLIVDEGPGLSGSSFAATAELLESLGVDPGRIVLAPSHAGRPGLRATPMRRSRWRRYRKLAPSFEALWRAPPADWFADITGPAAQAVDVSGGAWRRYRSDGAALPAQPLWERRKIRIESERGVFLARFAGLGHAAQVKAERAERLFREGFSPEPLALRRGFLLQPWVEAQPVNFFGPDRPALLDRVADYIALRAQVFRTAEPGAGPDRLAGMARANAAGLLGRPTPELDDLLAPLSTASLIPIAVDGRLHAWEWLRTADGRLIKTDAVDHASGHDLIGAQDAAWDVAGAAVEFGLDEPERERLARRVGQARGGRIDPAVLTAFEVSYCAFQGGAWDMALAQAPRAERNRAGARRDLYAGRLEALSSNIATTRLQPAEAPRIFTGKQMTS